MLAAHAAWPIIAATFQLFGLALLAVLLLLAFAVKLADRKHNSAAAVLNLAGAPTDAQLIEDEPERAPLLLAQRYGVKTFVLHLSGVWRGYFGRERVVATCQPELARELLLNRAHTEIRADRYKAGLFLPGLAGVLWMDGEAWKQHTAALRPVFHGANFGRHAAVMAREAHRVISSWPAGTDPRDLLASIKDVAMALLMVTGYGLEPSSPAARTLEAAINGYDEKKRLDKVADGSRVLAIPRFLWGFIRIYLDAQRIRSACHKICIDKRKQAASGDGALAAGCPGPKPCDWVGRMLECNFTEVEIFNEVNHLHAAHKAIALVLSFTVIELSRATPSVAQTVRQELEQRLVSSGETHHRREDLSHLPQTMALWKEVLRLHPVAMGVMRQTGERVQMPEFGVDLPEQTPVVILLQALHTHPEFWGEDPETFNPQRWIDADDISAIRTSAYASFSSSSFGSGSSDKTKVTRSAFIPFLDGQRQCAGRFLAELEFVIVLHELLQQLDIEGLNFPAVMPLISDPYPTWRTKPLFTVRRRGD